MREVVEAKKGIFEYTTPQEVDAGEWMVNHPDCDTIMDDLGQTMIVYAFTTNPIYNRELAMYRKAKYANHYIMKGISTDGIDILGER